MELNFINKTGDSKIAEIVQVREMDFEEKEKYYQPMIENIKTADYPEVNKAYKKRVLKNLELYINAIQQKAYCVTKGRKKGIVLPMYKRGKQWQYIPVQLEIFN